MPTLNSLTWIAEQNTKISADTHVLSYRCILNAANTSQTFNVPTSQLNPAQVVFPGIAPTGEPQQGRRLFVTKLVVRDANGNLGGSGATAGGLALIDNANSASPVTVASTGTLAASTPAYQIFTIGSGTGVIAPNDPLQIAYTAPAGATATATGFTVDVFGFYQQGI